MNIHVAAVSTANGIHFLTAAPTAEIVYARLGSYVEKHLEWSLKEIDAATVRQLLAAGQLAEAVRYYFERVGERWEKEYLRLETVPAP